MWYHTTSRQDPVGDLFWLGGHGLLRVPLLVVTLIVDWSVSPFVNRGMAFWAQGWTTRHGSHGTWRTRIDVQFSILTASGQVQWRWSKRTDELMIVPSRS